MANMPKKYDIVVMSPRARSSDTTYKLRLWQDELDAFTRESRRQGYDDLSSWVRAVLRREAGVTLDPETGKPVVND